MKHTTTIVLTIMVLALITLAMPRSADADETYTFDINLSGFNTTNPFSFSFTVPNFVTAGQSPTFTPFTITANSAEVGFTGSWQMVNDLVSSDGGSGLCFEFASVSITVPCYLEFVTFLSPPAGVFGLDLPGPLPTMDGTYLISGADLLYTGPNGIMDDLVGTLTIASTPTPEPSSLLLLGTGLLGLTIFKRRGQDESSADSLKTAARP